MFNLKNTISLFSYLLLSFNIFAADVYVSPLGNDTTGNGTISSPYATIQKGINVAVHNVDTVIARDGTYTGVGNRNLDFSGKAITLKSENSSSLTIIDCQLQGRGFVFSNGEGPDSVLDGLTITNGGTSSGVGMGAGIACFSASPTIKNCILWKNITLGSVVLPSLAKGLGGGIYLEGSSSNIVNCVFLSNAAQGAAKNSNTENGNDGLGGAIYSTNSTLSITNCTIFDNAALGGNLNSTVFGPVAGFGIGGAIAINSSVFTISNSFFSGNQAIKGSGFSFAKNGIGISPCVDLRNSQLNVSESALNINTFERILNTPTPTPVPTVTPVPTPTRTPTPVPTATPTPTPIGFPTPTPVPGTIVTVDLLSIGTEDGRTESASSGAIVGSAFSAANIRIGDTPTNGNYRSILSFNASSLPVGTILSADLHIKATGSGGSVSALTLPIMEIKSGFFGNSVALANDDWQAIPNSIAGSILVPAVNATTINPLNSDALSFINNKFQIKIRYSGTLTDNDNTADFVAFGAGGEDSTVTNRSFLRVRIQQ